MTVKEILIEPNKFLRQISKPVEKVTKDEQKLMDDMLDTMYAANGIGLAAIQIGIPKRIIVMDLSKDPDKKEPKYMPIMLPKQTDAAFTILPRGTIIIFILRYLNTVYFLSCQLQL